MGKYSNEYVILGNNRSSLFLRLLPRGQGSLPKFQHKRDAIDQVPGEITAAIQRLDRQEEEAS